MSHGDEWADERGTGSDGLGMPRPEGQGRQTQLQAIAEYVMDRICNLMILKGSSGCGPLLRSDAADRFALA